MEELKTPQAILMVIIVAAGIILSVLYHYAPKEFEMFFSIGYSILILGVMATTLIKDKTVNNDTNSGE